MKIVEVKYGVTRNLGDFNSERIDATAVVADGDDPNKVLADLRAFLNVTTAPVQKAEPPKTLEQQVEAQLAAEDVKKAVAEEKARRKAKEKAMVEAKKQEELKEKFPWINEHASKGRKKINGKYLEGNDIVRESEKLIQERVLEDATKIDPNFRVVGAAYNREMDLHKKLVGEFLNKEFPNWKNEAKKAKEVSMSMHGEPFLDGDGIVLETFKVKFREKMA